MPLTMRLRRHEIEDALQLRSGTVLQKAVASNQLNRQQDSQKPRRAKGLSKTFKSSKFERNGLLGQLPASLLGYLWPPNHVVRGLLVAKWLRDDLYNNIVSCSFSSTPGFFWEPDTPEYLAASVSRWKHKGARLSLYLDEDLCGHISLGKREKPNFCFLSLLRTFPRGVGAILVHLDLCHCDLGETSVEALSQSVQDCAVLRNLLLRENGLQDASAFKLSVALGGCPALQHLDLGGNFFFDFPGLLLSFLDNCKALRRLDLWSWAEDIYKFNDDLPEDVRFMISESQHAASPGLLALDMSAYAAESDFMIPKLRMELASVLSRCTSLRFADLSLNGLGVAGLEEICESGFPASLQHLDLSSNDISNAELFILTSALEKCRHIRTLILHGNDIDAEGGRSIAILLESCCNLDHLDLSRNLLGDEGCVHIARGLERSKCPLKRLDITCNQIHSSGADVLSKGLQKCKAPLEYLSVAFNWDLGDDGVRWIAAAVKKCKTISTVDLRRINCSPAGIKKLAQASTPKKRRVQYILGSGGFATYISEQQREELDKAWAKSCSFDWRG